MQGVALVGRHEPLGRHGVAPPVLGHAGERRGARRPRRDRRARMAPVQAALDELVTLLALEPIEVNIFRGRSPDENRQRVFGGQVAGQALVAAARTVDDPARLVHSLHAYFLRPGDPTVPILYEVDRLRDGRSFLDAARGRDPARPGDLQPAGQLPRPRAGPDHQIRCRPGCPTRSRSPTGTTAWRPTRTSSATGTTGRARSTCATSTATR